jgi:hypothetical protein
MIGHPIGGDGRSGVISASSPAQAAPALGAIDSVGLAAGLVDTPPLDSPPADGLIGIDDVQRTLNRSRASVYRYTNTDPRNLNPPFNPKRLNPEYRSDQKDALLFHPNEVARFARDVLRIKEVTVEVLHSPATASQQLLLAILSELKEIRALLQQPTQAPTALVEPARRARSRPGRQPEAGSGFSSWARALGNRS